MEFLYLSTDKNIKTLKPDLSGDRINFYAGIGACLYYQDLCPGKYYVYEYKEDEISISGGSSSTIISFSKEVNVICIGSIDYKGLYIDYLDELKGLFYNNPLFSYQYDPINGNYHPVNFPNYHQTNIIPQDDNNYYYKWIDRYKGR
jgi:hypothetical protein